MSFPSMPPPCLWLNAVGPTPWSEPQFVAKSDFVADPAFGVRADSGHGFGSLCSGSALVRFRFMQSQFGRGYCLVFSRLTTFMGKHHRHVVQAPVLENLHTALAILLNSLSPYSTH